MEKSKAKSRVREKASLREQKVILANLEIRTGLVHNMTEVSLKRTVIDNQILVYI